MQCRLPSRLQTAAPTISASRQLRVPQYAIMVFLLASSCWAQVSTTVGGPCEGCEAIYEYGQKVLRPIDTLPQFGQIQPSLKIYGTVYKRDARRPASDVILYIYHTNRQGIYPTKGDETGWARRHGSIRGWVKTGQDGQYVFYTFRPAAYPDGSEPEHIHITVKEPDKNEYYLDDYLFEDDPLLTPQIRSRLTNRGGSGIVVPREEDGMMTIKRDIILGENIPGYRR